MASGWIKLHRKFTSWGWYSDSNTKAVFLHLLLTANYEEAQWKGITLHPGQTIVGRDSLSQKLGIPPQSIRTSLKRLKSTNEITIEPTSNYSIITIVKWEEYQLEEFQSTSQSTSQPTNNQPAANQQLTTLKEVKKERSKERKNALSFDEIKLFDEFWHKYPWRITDSGKKTKGSRGTAEQNWLRVNPEIRHLLPLAAQNYSVVMAKDAKWVKDAHRWIKDEQYETYINPQPRKQYGKPTAEAHYEATGDDARRRYAAGETQG